MPWYIPLVQEVNTDAVFSLAWSEIDMKLVTTSGNHNATLFDVHDDGSMTELNTFKAHKSSVKTACFEPNSAGTSILKLVCQI